MIIILPYRMHYNISKLTTFDNQNQINTEPVSSHNQLDLVEITTRHDISDEDIYY
jgi:hypothetical protein